MVNKDLRKLTLFIVLYVRKNLIELKAVPDKKRIEGSPELKPDFDQITASIKPQSLIACVDDK